MRKLMMMAALMGAAGASAAPPPLTGQWGGDRTILTLTEQGGRIEQDCASGQFATPVRPDSRGQFSTSGRFDEHQPGPQPEMLAGSPAQYDFHVAGNTLHLSIRVGDAPPRHLTLVAGQGVKLLRCY